MKTTDEELVRATLNGDKTALRIINRFDLLGQSIIDQMALYDVL